MSVPYVVSSLPAHEVAELQRLMAEEIKEVAVFFTDPDGIITVWNRGAEEMKGFTAEDAIGSHLELLYVDSDRARGWAHHNLGEALKHGFYREETWRRRKDGTMFWARIALTALRDRSGRHVGFSKVTMDLTDHKLLERCVKERDQTSRVLRAAHAGMWTWNPETDQVEVSTNFLSLLGRQDVRRSMPLGEWMQLVDPQDRAAVLERFQGARAGLPGAALNMEMRLCKPDGSCRWFHGHGEWYRESPDQAYELSGVSVDIHDLKTAEEELRRAISKLKEADARKDEFLAMLAHELRNPLAPIRSAAELLKRGKAEQSRVQKTSEIIARQVDHMTSLVNDLLDVSRVTRGLTDLQKVPVDIRQVVTDAVEQVNPLMRSRAQQFTMQLAAEQATVLGDEKRLVQVVSNLLNNAAKYTQEGGSIQLLTRVHEGRVTLTVTDNGIGMEPELVARVFDLFAQAERTPDRSSGGLGLGLALVKSLVELHGGSVGSSSAGIGKGSTFSVTLPLAPALEDPQSSPAGAREGPGRALRVMVVDDNADAAETLAMFLEAGGHEVSVENSAQRALARSAAERPDVFLLDIGLPEMDGRELARRLKAQPETAAATLIAVTGYGHEQDRAATHAAGFSHHFTKPFDPDKLLALLSRLHQAENP